MNCRERVLKAIKGEEIYPIPVDVWENGIAPVLESKLIEHFALQTDDHEGVYICLGACMRWGTPVYIGPEPEEGNFNFKPAYPFKKINKSIWGTWDGIETYTGEIKRPFASVNSVSEIYKHKWPNPDWFDYKQLCWLSDAWETSQNVLEWSNKYSDYARVVGGWNPIFSRVMDMFGIEEGLVNIAYSSNLIQATIDHISSFYEEYYERIGQACEGHADIMAFGDDFAGQYNMLLSPEKWRQYFLPIYRKLFAIAHKYKMKTQMHMCGNIRPVIGDLIDAGLDIYENLVTISPEMEPKILKREFGKDITFYGGIDVQQFLPFASPDQVKEEVYRFIDVMAADGGYILSTTHFLLDDIPYENVLAMYEAAHKILSRP